MNSDSSALPSDDENDGVAHGIRSLTDAKAWLAKIALDGGAQIEIKDPPRAVGGGLLIVSASLLRKEDGGRVNLEIYCYDDRCPVPAKVDLFPLPPARQRSGAN